MELVLNAAISNPEGPTQFASDLPSDSNLNKMISITPDEGEIVATKQVTDTELFLEIFNQQIVDIPTVSSDSTDTLLPGPIAHDTQDDDKEQELDFINLYFPMEQITQPKQPKEIQENTVYDVAQTRKGEGLVTNTTRLAQNQNNTDREGQTGLDTSLTTLTTPLGNLLGMSKPDSGNSTPIATERLFTELENPVAAEQQVTERLPEINNTNIQMNREPNQPSTNLRLDTPVTDKTWSNEFAERILFVSQQPIKTAIMHINPPELGPLEISVSMKQDKATVQITSEHPLIRDLIESSLPKLRDLFQEQGLQLTDSTVSHESQMNHQYKKPDSNDNPYYHTEQQEEVITLETPSPIQNQKQLGAVDYYI